MGGAEGHKKHGPVSVKQLQKLDGKYYCDTAYDIVFASDGSDTDRRRLTCDQLEERLLEQVAPRRRLGANLCGASVTKTKTCKLKKKHDGPHKAKPRRRL